MQYELHQANLNDYKIISSTFDQYRLFYKQESDIEGAGKYIKERLKNNEAVIFFININNKCAGFTQLYPTFDSVRLRKKIVLYDLFVCEEFRRQGFGKVLMNAAKGYAELNSFGSIELSTAKKNLAGQSLYESLGYIQDQEFYSYDLEI
ncbi:MAG: GNAT family N-acetyltransferase [Candidatus Pelagibacterales bacterium]|jgi:ribosomal protein S18 acetylase RimI-like enzyme|tara:strand:- start:1666 stop:2112 length:447 start_codon:yes stop_codon:yes gene_type:complete